MAKTLLTLRNQLRIEVRDPDGIRFEDPDLNYSLNQAYRRAYLKAMYAQKGYFVVDTTHNIVAGNAVITLPNDHFHTVRLEYINGDLQIPLFERNRGATVNYTGGSTFNLDTDAFVYHFEGNTIVLEPTPQTTKGDGIKHTYVQALLESDDLSADGDTVHADFKDMWCDVVVLDAALNCLSQIETLGATLSQNLVDRFSAANKLFEDTLGIRTQSPNRNRRRKGFFR